MCYKFKLIYIFMDNLSIFMKCLNIELIFKIRVKFILYRCVVWMLFLV